MSSLSNATWRLGGRPAYGSLVRWPQTNTALVAKPLILRSMPSWSEVPNATISMKIRSPKKTPTAVSAVRSLCRARLVAISWKLSRSNIRRLAWRRSG